MNRPRLGRTPSAVLAACAALALLVGCGGTDQPTTSAADDAASPALRSLIKAAQKEGELVWYSVPAENVAREVSDDFSHKYGITVKFVRLPSADLAQRFSAEAESGKPAADLFVASLTPFIGKAREQGWTTPLPKADIPDYPGSYPGEYVLANEGTAIVQIQPSGIAVNDDQAGGAIKDWKDILDPKWKRKIILVDPRTSAAYTPFWNLMAKEYGEDFLSKVKAQKPIIAPGVAPAMQQLAAGEGAIVMPGVQSIAEDLKAKGAPIGYVQPEASTGPELVPGIAAKAPHPKAARLFVHYLLSEKGNAKLNATPGSSSPRDPRSLPFKYTFNRDLTGLPPERVEKLLGLAS